MNPNEHTRISWRLILPGLVLAIGVLAIGLSYWLPAAAGQGLIRAKLMVLAYSLNLFLPGVAGILGLSIASLLRLSGRACQPAVIVSALLGLVGTWLLSSGEKRDAIFLSAAADHIDRQVGVTEIRKFAEQLKADVDAGTISRNRLTASHFPPVWTGLFAGDGVQAVFYFGPDDRCQSVEIYWGGNFYKWGIAVNFGDDLRRKQTWKVMQITNDLCFFLEQS
jgi:hypothetical protein